MSHPNGREYSENFGIQTGIYSREKDECINGHPYDEENTVWKRRKSKNPEFPDSWMRNCRVCLRDSQKRYRERKLIMKLYQEVISE